MYNPFSLENKTILVTGASSGIGKAIAIECSKMGAKVILSARNEERLKETLSLMSGDGHQIIISDITTDEGLNHLIENIPNINGTVLCAGKGLTLPIPFCTREKYSEIFNVNFFSTSELIRLLYKKKRIQNNGSIVIISSIGGVYRYSLGNSIYGTSKAAINSFMHFCANEFSTRKIRVNSINPGMVNTPLINKGTLTEEDFKKDIERYLLKRYGEPEDIAFGAIYLLSDASSWVTGQSLVIDGGVTSI